jgi:hypothetical protein
MNDNVKENFIALKSLMKEIEKDLKEQMKVEDKVPEDKTNSMKNLLEFTKDEMKKRPSTSKPGKVEKGKKSSKKDIKKSVTELKSLIDEIRGDIMKSDPYGPNAGEMVDNFLTEEEMLAISRADLIKREAEGEGSTGAGSTGQSPDARKKEREFDIPKEEWPF